MDLLNHVSEMCYPVCAQVFLLLQIRVVQRKQMEMLLFYLFRIAEVSWSSDVCGVELVFLVWN